MKKRLTFISLGVVLLHFCVNISHCEDIIFYDDDGNVFTLSITGGCYNFKPKWNKRATSIDIDQGCFKVWDGNNCQGQHLMLGKNHGSSHDLKIQRFGKKASSISLCSPEEEEKVAGRYNGRSHQPANPTQRGNAHHRTTRKPTQPTLDEIQKIAVEEHNKYRRKHGVPDLKGDPVIHADAQKYAEYLATSNLFEPTTMDGKYGTNLATSFRRNKGDAVRDAIKRWYDKIQFYDYDRPGYNVGGKPTGSFTAVVWKATTHVGLGIAWNEGDEGYIICAFYSPAANVRSQFKANVLPPIPSSAANSKT